MRLRDDRDAVLSPYLLSHIDNPVDWWQWGPDAFAEARRRDVPVLLSIGYSACHWCHVMAHESFEDEGTGSLLNSLFVAIKVDREERPDVDAVYMRATQMLTGQGGWPMTVFVDTAGRPFHAGTYYPAQDRHGMPAFQRVLRAVATAWREDRARIERISAQVANALGGGAGGFGKPAIHVPGPAGPVDRQALAAQALTSLGRDFDRSNGGFGSAPKFPPAMALEFLLRHHSRTGDPLALSMVRRTCQGMAAGGMYDQLGGGFARYSVDEAWVVPHFEKMLYDNALLARLYLHLWRATASPLAQRVCRETCDFLLAELRTPQGGFASALDADSDPVLPGQQREGAYYAWSPAQLRQALGADAEAVGGLLQVTGAGTFESGTSVLQLPDQPPADWARIKGRLLAARRLRPAPARDDKVLAGWNGLAIAALAEAGVMLQEPDYLAAAASCADLLRRVHYRGDRLMRLSRDGVCGEAAGVLEDYGALAEGLLALYQATGEVPWLEWAAALLAAAGAHFGDGGGGFYDTAQDAQALVARPRDPSESAVPSGWALVTGAMVSHAALTGDSRGRQDAERALDLLVSFGAAAHPRFFGGGLAVVEAVIAGPLEVAVIGEPGSDLHRAAMAGTSPGLVVAVGRPGATHPGLLADRPSLGGRPAAYVCRDFTCQLPTSEVAALRRQVS